MEAEPRLELKHSDMECGHFKHVLTTAPNAISLFHFSFILWDIGCTACES